MNFCKHNEPKPVVFFLWVASISFLCLILRTDLRKLRNLSYFLLNQLSSFSSREIHETSFSMDKCIIMNLVFYCLDSCLWVKIYLGQDQLGDVLHWIRQVVALVCGLLWGAIPVVGGLWIVMWVDLWISFFF